MAHLLTPEQVQVPVPSKFGMDCNGKLIMEGDIVIASYKQPFASRDEFMAGNQSSAYMPVTRFEAKVMSIHSTGADVDTSTYGLVQVMADSNGKMQQFKVNWSPTVSEVEFKHRISCPSSGPFNEPRQPQSNALGADFASSSTNPGGGGASSSASIAGASLAAAAAASSEKNSQLRVTYVRLIQRHFSTIASSLMPSDKIVKVDEHTDTTLCMPDSAGKRMCELCIRAMSTFDRIYEGVERADQDDGFQWSSATALEGYEHIFFKDLLQLAVVSHCGVSFKSALGDAYEVNDTMTIGDADTIKSALDAIWSLASKQRRLCQAEQNTKAAEPRDLSPGALERERLRKTQRMQLDCGKQLTTDQAMAGAAIIENANLSRIRKLSLTASASGKAKKVLGSKVAKDMMTKKKQWSKRCKVVGQLSGTSFLDSNGSTYLISELYNDATHGPVADVVSSDNGKREMLGADDLISFINNGCWADGTTEPKLCEDDLSDDNDSDDPETIQLQVTERGKSKAAKKGSKRATGDEDEDENETLQ